MALYDRAWLLQRCKDIARRMHADETIDDTKWYRLLTEAERHWMEQLAVYAPEANRMSELLISDDDGLTYSLTREPLGAVVILESLDGRELHPGPEWSARTGYVLNDQTISFPGGVARTFTDGPYAIYHPAPENAIDEDHEPTLKPARARALLPYRAVILYASEGGLKNPAYAQNLEDEEFYGNPQIGKPGLLASLKQQYQANYGGGSARPWYRNRDMR